MSPYGLVASVSQQSQSLTQSCSAQPCRQRVAAAAVAQLCQPRCGGNTETPTRKLYIWPNREPSSPHSAAEEEEEEEGVGQLPYTFRNLIVPQSRLSDCRHVDPCLHSDLSCFRSTLGRFAAVSFWVLLSLSLSVPSLSDGCPSVELARAWAFLLR